MTSLAADPRLRDAERFLIGPAWIRAVICVVLLLLTNVSRGIEHYSVACVGWLPNGGWINVGAVVMFMAASECLEALEAYTGLKEAAGTVLQVGCWHGATTTWLMGVQIRTAM